MKPLLWILFGTCITVSCQVKVISASPEHDSQLSPAPASSTLMEPRASINCLNREGTDACTEKDVNNIVDRHQADTTRENYQNHPSPHLQRDNFANSNIRSGVEARSTPSATQSPTSATVEEKVLFDWTKWHFAFAMAVLSAVVELVVFGGYLYWSHRRRKAKAILRYKMNLPMAQQSLRDTVHTNEPPRREPIAQEQKTSTPMANRTFRQNISSEEQGRLVRFAEPPTDQERREEAPVRADLSRTRRPAPRPKRRYSTDSV